MLPLVLLAAGATFSIVCSIIAIPLSDFLAEATEAYSTPPLRPTGESGINYRLRVMSLDVAKTLFAFTLAVLGLLISWIPLVNFFSGILTCLMIAFQYLSFPQTRRRMGIQESFGFLFKNLSPCLGFGLAYGFLFAIPFVGCFVLPLAVVGGTLLHARALQLPKLV